MTRAQAIERIAKLRELINDYRYQYHVLDESIMSEAAADSLKHELSELESQYPDLVTTDSPTQRVAGQALDKFTKVEHKIPMMSLADVFDENELDAWISRMKRIKNDIKDEYLCDIKMDGLACALIYQNGLLETAITRGDSRIGEDVTANVRTIQNVPLSLRPNQRFAHFLRGRTEIRGEIVMFKHDFDNLNKSRSEQGLPLFKNPRNLAAGTIRQLDPALVAARSLNFIGYDIIRDDPADTPTIAFGYSMLQELGITTSGLTRVVNGKTEIVDYLKHLDNMRKRLDFNTDGAVIKLNDRSDFASLGVIGKTPRAAVAYKFAAEETTTVIKDIVISIGRTGVATPVAVFEPVNIAGTTVQHASLHNADEIERLDVRRGDTVIVYKAGDIIPQVKTVLTDLRPKDSKAIDFKNELKLQFPELEFYRAEGEVAFRAKGLTGPIILKKSLKHFASKSALDIDTLGEKNVDTLVDSNLVSDIADIYTINVNDLLHLDRFANKSAEKLVEAINSKKSPSLEKFLFGLGIRHVGAQTATDIANRFESLESIQKATLNELLEIDGIGEIVAESIVTWFADPENRALLTKFSDLGLQPQNVVRSSELSGLRFVVTGTLNTMSRDEAADKIRSKGGIFQSSVAKDTDYLVAGGKTGASKIKKAEQYGTKIINEQQLIELIG